jgi:hypothetical protein
MRYRKPSEADGARKRSAAAIAAIDRTIRADSTPRMRLSRSVIAVVSRGMAASGRGLEA